MLLRSAQRVPCRSPGRRELRSRMGPPGGRKRLGKEMAPYAPWGEAKTWSMRCALVTASAAPCRADRYRAYYWTMEEATRKSSSQSSQ